MFDFISYVRDMGIEVKILPARQGVLIHLEVRDPDTGYAERHEITDQEARGCANIDQHTGQVLDQMAARIGRKKAQREAASYLSRYQVAKAEVKDIERRIERIRSEMMGVKGIDYTGGDMPKQQNRTGDLSDYIVRIDDLIQDWKAAQDRAITVMREISAAIEAVGHDQARRVLMLHFVDGYEYEKIAEMFPCDIRSVFRWRQIGLRKVVIKCQ